MMTPFARGDGVQSITLPPNTLHILTSNFVSLNCCTAGRGHAILRYFDKLSTQDERTCPR